MVPSAASAASYRVVAILCRQQLAGEREDAADLVGPLLMVGVFVERHARVENVVVLGVGFLQTVCDHLTQSRLNVGMLPFDETCMATPSSRSN